MKDTTAVILGGGQGKRLFPLTLERAKPAVGFAGKYRLIDIPISNCINSGIKRIFVLTQFLSASLHRHIMQTYQFDTFTDGLIDIIAAEKSLVREGWFQGTADAVRATLRHTTYYAYKNMLILSGDHLYRMDYKKLIKFHQKSNADITISVSLASKSEASEFGLLKADEDGEIQEFVEKPTDEKIINKFKASHQFLNSLGLSFKSDKYMASMGIYVFKPKILFELLKDRSKTDFGKDVIPSAINNFKVMAYPFNGYWRDIGTIEAYFNENISLVDPEPEFKLYSPNWPIYTRTRSLPPSRIMNSEIQDSIIVEGSDIKGATVINSIVGTRSIINKNTKLEKVVMLGADFYEGETFLKPSEMKQKNGPPLGIGENCHICRAIIDKNARIGKSVTIRTDPSAADKDEQNCYVRNGITIVPRGAVIPDGTTIIN
ncbi:glucose-1-phosphate adenylyltransferase [candidate division KSB1 bacterium 4572_119]|nr:MAG: glucose-1-phosphate adenylyltransferase [candidate division KSB1 bacterium 4572_119]